MEFHLRSISEFKKALMRFTLTRRKITSKNFINAAVIPPQQKEKGFW
jgi:hypothetical protein